MVDRLSRSLVGRVCIMELLKFKIGLHPTWMFHLSMASLGGGGWSPSSAFRAQPPEAT